MHMEHEPERRTRTLSDDDIRAIAGEIVAATAAHPCRFLEMNPDDLREAISFYKNVNKIMTESKGVFRNTIIVLVITAGFGLMGKGVLAWFIKELPK